MILILIGAALLAFCVGFFLYAWDDDNDRTVMLGYYMTYPACLGGGLLGAGIIKLFL